MSRIFLVATLLVVLVIAQEGIVGAHIGGVDPEVIHGCVTNSGVVNIINEGEECSMGRTPIDWNAIGPIGPQGIQGPIGPIGPAGPPGLTFLKTSLFLTPCAGNNPIETTLVTHSFVLTEDSKVLFQGFIHTATKFASSGNVQVIPQIDSVTVPANTTCIIAGPQPDTMSIPLSLVADVTAGSHTVRWNALKHNGADLSVTSSKINIFIVE